MQTRTGTRTHTVRLAIVCVVLALITVVGGTVAMTYRVSATAQPAVPLQQLHPQVQITLRVLDRLHSYGYTINTEARADRAIRSWQRSNGLNADGQVGSDTLRSLGLSASVAPSAKPTTVHASVTPAPPVADPGPSGGDVESIIRDVWSGQPANVVDHAVAIAHRESRFVPTAANSCCYGIFQVYFSVHRAWLADFGVNQASDLFDPRVNATVALALYEQAGWSPWAL